MCCVTFGCVCRLVKEQNSLLNFFLLLQLFPTIHHFFYYTLNTATMESRNLSSSSVSILSTGNQDSILSYFIHRIASVVRFFFSIFIMVPYISQYEYEYGYVTLKPAHLLTISFYFIFHCKTVTNQHWIHDSRSRRRTWIQIIKGHA